jgi:carboxypeptidase family protein
MFNRRPIPVMLILLAACAELTPRQSNRPTDQVFTIAGNVSSQGTAVSDAEVTLVMTASPPIVHVRTTDSHGSFRFEFLVSRPTIPYTLTVKKTGYGSATLGGVWPALGSSAENPAPITYEVKLLPISQ